MKPNKQDASNRTEGAQDVFTYENLENTEPIVAPDIEKIDEDITEINYTDGEWEVIVKYNGDVLRIEKDMGVTIEILNGQYAIVTLEQSQLPKLSAYKEIEYMELPKKLSLFLRTSLDRACITPVQRLTGFNLTGKGTLVAIIDSGIDYTHPDFKNDDGTTRIISIWDQTGLGKPPIGFRNGAEYNAQDIDKALESDDPFSIIPQVDINGHGTAVAGVAVGNGKGSNGVNKGVAPEASIIVVKLGERGRKSFARTTELMRAIKYVSEKAMLLEMPLIINISFGTNNGSHDGSSLFETYIDDMSRQWKTSIVVASGNEGSAAHHYSGKISSREIKEIDFFTSEGNRSFFITLWKNFVDVFTIELILPSGKTTGQIVPTDRSKVVNFNDNSIAIEYGQPHHYNEDQNIFFQIDSIVGDLPSGVWRIKIHASTILDGRFDIWLPVSEEVSSSTAFSTPSTNTTLTLPSTSNCVITVGAYWQSADSIANFSGKGYTRNNVYVKPDLVAPGIDILTAKIGGGYDAVKGTSVSAPFVTGAVALMMQWGIIEGNDPFLFGQRVKAFLQIGAIRHTDLSYPNPEWGYGALCLQNTMNILKDYMKGGKVSVMDYIAQESTPESIEEMPLKEFISLPTTVGFSSINNKRFRDYIADKPYIREGSIFENGYVSAYLPEDRMESVVKADARNYFQYIPSLYTLQNKESMESAGIARVHQQPYLDLKGEGVLIGFVDTGIDYTQRSFKYEDGTSKIRYIWDQTLQGKTPEDIEFGAEFNQDEINEALKSENPYDIVPHKDDVGHGTFLAALAAGREEGEYLGAAPDSEIIVVKLKNAHPYYYDYFNVPGENKNIFEYTDIMLGLKFIVQKAEELNRPLVICLGLGSNFGSHDGTSLLEEYIHFISTGEGIVICSAAGNEGDAKHHTNGNIGKTGDKKTFDIKVGVYAKTYQCHILTEAWDKISVSIKSPTGEIVSKFPVELNRLYRKELIFEKSIIEVEYLLETSRLIVLHVTNPTPGIWEITLHGDIIVSGEYHAWLPITNIVSYKQKNKYKAWNMSKLLQKEKQLLRY